MIRGIDVKSPEGIQRILVKPISLPDFLCPSRIDIDGPLREKGEHAADISYDEIDFRKTLQDSAIHQPSHRHGAIKGPAEDQCRHDIDPRCLGSERRGRMDIDRQLVFGDLFVEWKQLLSVERLAIEVGEATETSQPQLVHRTLQLIQRVLNGARRQGKEADEALGMIPAESSDG